MSDPYIGEIKVFAFSYAPQYYEMCAGQTLPVGQYQALYSLLGNVFGGTSPTTFGIPDLRGRMAIGQGQQPAAGQIFQWGQTTGAWARTLTLSTANLPAHTHPATAIPIMTTQTLTMSGSSTASGTITATGEASGNISIPAQAAGAASASPAPSLYLGKSAGGSLYAGGASTNLAPFSATLPATVSASVSLPVPVTVSGPVTLGSPVSVGVGANQTTNTPIPVSILSPSVCLTYVIATQGIYPVRP